MPLQLRLQLPFYLLFLSSGRDGVSLLLTPSQREQPKLWKRKMHCHALVFLLAVSPITKGMKITASRFYSLFFFFNLITPSPPSRLKMEFTYWFPFPLFSGSCFSPPNSPLFLSGLHSCQARLWPRESLYLEVLWLVGQHPSILAFWEPLGKMSFRSHLLWTLGPRASDRYVQPVLTAFLILLIS